MNYEELELKLEDLYSNSKQFNSLEDYRTSSSEYFKSSFDEEYFNYFGLDYGDTYDESIREDSYETSDKGWVYVEHFESHVDSGVSHEDYFKGYVISE